MKFHWLWSIPLAAALAGCAPTGYGAGPYDGGYRYGGYPYGGRPYGYPRQGWSHGHGYGHPPPRDPRYLGPPVQAEPPGAYYRDRPSSGAVYSPIGRPQGPVPGPSGFVEGSSGGAPLRGPRQTPVPPGHEGVVMDSASSGSARPFTGAYGGVVGGASGGASGGQ